MTFTRLPDWPHRLSALVAQRLQTPFAWGPNDCVTFASDAVLAMTGQDPIAQWRGQWSTAREAFRVLRQFGGVAGAARRLELEEVAPALARRGDVVLLLPPGRPHSMRGALGVCIGERVAAPGPQGLSMSRCGEGVCAWRV